MIFKNITHQSCNLYKSSLKMIMHFMIYIKSIIQKKNVIKCMFNPLYSVILKFKGKMLIQGISEASNGILILKCTK